jgi:hypothetical protein
LAAEKSLARRRDLLPEFQSDLSPIIRRVIRRHRPARSLLEVSDQWRETRSGLKHDVVEGLAPREAIKITAALSLLIAGLFGILGFRRRRTA